MSNGNGYGYCHTWSDLSRSIYTQPFSMTCFNCSKWPLNYSHGLCNNSTCFLQLYSMAYAFIQHDLCNHLPWTLKLLNIILTTTQHGLCNYSAWPQHRLTSAWPLHLLNMASATIQQGLNNNSGWVLHHSA